jgi:hypothetical protein
VRTDPKRRLASLAATNSRPEHHFSMNRHPPTQAAFDSGNGSCQGRTSFDGGLLMKVAEPEPRCFQRRGSLSETIAPANEFDLVLTGPGTTIQPPPSAHGGFGRHKIRPAVNCDSCAGSVRLSLEIGCLPQLGSWRIYRRTAAGLYLPLAQHPQPSSYCKFAAAVLAYGQPTI